MLVHFDDIPALNRYHLITQSVLPRPIAWILTKNDSDDSSDKYNLAPFSYFTPVSSDPALLVVSIGNKADNILKDTKRNLMRDKECVIHIPSVDLVEQVNHSAATLAYGESELADQNLTLIDFVENLPRVQQARVALHCHLYDSHQLSQAQTVCYLEVKAMYIEDDLVTQTENRTIINSQALNPLSRLGGNDYNFLGEILTIKRPD